MAVSVLELLTPDLITLDLRGEKRDEAIRTVAHPLAGRPAMLNFPAYCEAVLAREETSSTATDFGLAIPHARTQNVREIVLAAGRCDGGVNFGTEAQPQPVQLIFVIGTPLGMVREHLALIGELARRLRDRTLRERLLSAPSREEFLAALGG